MHGVDFIKDLAVIMLVAGVVTVIFHYLKQPVVLGYIIAGLIIGPYTTAVPFISDEKTIKTLGELGVVKETFRLPVVGVSIQHKETIKSMSFKTAAPAPLHTTFFTGQPKLISSKSGLTVSTIPALMAMASSSPPNI